MSEPFVRYPIISLDAYVSILDDIDNATIVGQIIASEQVDPDASLLSTNSHTYYEDVLLPETDEIRYLQNRIVGVMNDISGVEYEMTESWSIILEPGQSISAHSHHVGPVVDPNEYFAFAYYPFAPEGSCGLRFLATHSNTISGTIEVPISTGTLLIFNSYLLHWTNRQMQDSIRVNVSGNLAPVNPTTIPHDDWSHYRKA